MRIITTSAYDLAIGDRVQPVNNRATWYIVEDKAFGRDQADYHVTMLKFRGKADWAVSDGTDRYRLALPEAVQPDGH